MWRFDQSYCLCCRAKKTRDDFLFKSAKSKLSEEMDILEIVKKLRVHQFACQQMLQPHQRDLVNFFQDYKLEEPKPPSANEFEQSVLNRRVSEDHAPNNVQRSLDERNNSDDDDMEVEDKAVNSLYDSISKLDPNNPIDKKIMRRVTNQDVTTRANDGRPMQLSA